MGTCLFDGYNYNNENTTTYTFKEMAELEDIIKKLHNLDYEIKKGKIDKNVGLENFLLRL